jgi:hypothetical protein
MLMWHRRPWLIDHGATLYFHHSPGWEDHRERARAAFPPIKDHVLLGQAPQVAAIDEPMAEQLERERIRAILDRVPDAWLTDGDPSDTRAAYERYLVDRLERPRAFAEEAARAR